YEALPQLRLQGAILIQPLTEEQVDTYLAAMGEELAGVRSALRGDAELRELATTPLLLNIMILTYQGAPTESLPVTGTLEDRRSMLLTAYVERMFARRGATSTYPRERTVRWLAWLARALSQQSRPSLYLEDLQPDWLPAPGARRQYILVDRLVGGLVGAMTLWLAYLIVWLVVRPVFWPLLFERSVDWFAIEWRDVAGLGW